MSPNAIVSFIASILLLTSSGIAFSSLLPSLSIELPQLGSQSVASR